MNFGQKLKELRNQWELTQSQLAERIDTSKSNISKYEANIIEPNLKTLVLISEYFNVSIDFLLKEEITTSDYDFKSASEAKETLSWKTVQELYKNAALLESEEMELLDYYNELSLKNKRWIMGQMIDLIKRENENTQTCPKAQ